MTTVSQVTLLCDIGSFNLWRSIWLSSIWCAHIPHRKTYNCKKKWIIKNLLTRRRIHRPNNQVSQRPRRVIVKWPVLTFWKEDGGGYIDGGDDDEAYGDIDILKAGWIKLHWWWWCTENWNDMMRENGKQAWEKEGGCSWFTFQRGEGAMEKVFGEFVCKVGGAPLCQLGQLVTLSVTVDHR